VVLTAVQLLASAGFVASVAYLAFALSRVLAWRPGPVTLPADPPGVTVAKPLCGLEAEMEENLRSWMAQDYPRFQVVFGVRDADDPAIPFVRKVMADFPAVDATLVVHNGKEPGTNRKAANLVRICRVAKHPIVVVSDGDTRATPDLLTAIASRYADPAVGAVSCLTVGRPLPGLPSTLGAMFLNEEFLPSVLVSQALQPLDFCLGPTMSARRASLEAIGGFEGLTNHLADDYLLGNRIAALGQKVELAPRTVTNVLHEPSLRALFLHELRWARTIRTVRPLSYAGTVVTFSVVWALGALLAFRFSPAGWLALAVALALRAGIHRAVRRTFGLGRRPAAGWMPLREILSFFVYCASHGGRSVFWKKNQFRLSGDGRLHREVDET